MKQFEGRKLSWVRVTTLVVVLLALGVAGMSRWQWLQDAQAAQAEQSSFSAYADATVTPQVRFEEPTSAAARNVVLSFVVATPGKSCQPSWGRDYPLDEASTELDLDRRIARLKQRGGEAMVSFGGAINDELATVCTQPDRLLEAYEQVVDRYDVRAIDLDLEGATLTDAAANQRRAAAIAALQSARADQRKPLRVWVTVPVAPDGIPAAGQRAVSALLEGGVELAGVNVMTMNYGASRPSGQSMADASIAALNAAHRQLDRVYSRVGQPLGPATLWRRIGATPMIGQNDEARDVFGVADARRLNQFARDKGLGRLSMWSLNRDRTCGENYPDVRVVSSSCSGVDQKGVSFAELLGKGLSDRPATSDAKPRVLDQPAPADATDDPATSPYPIWNEQEVYVENTRVVWHRNVYTAKWWTSGDVPDDPTVDAYSAPWELVGPVLPGERPVPEPTLPAGTYPTWDQSKVYTKGERVLVDGVAFSAKWWTKGDNPVARSTQADPSPWVRLTDHELRRAAKH